MDVAVVQADAIEPGSADRPVHIMTFPAALAPHVHAPSGVTRDGHVGVKVTLILRASHPARYDHRITVDLACCFETFQECDVR